MIGLERTLKAFANKRRLAITKYLKIQLSASVGDIASAIKLSFRSTSKHLGILAAADIVENESHGRQIYYRLNQRPTRDVRKLLSLL